MSIEALSRRSVLGGFVVTAVGGVVGYFVARNSSAAKRKNARTAANNYGAGNASTGALAKVSQIPASPGGLILSGPKVVLIRSGDDTVRAFSAVCTHQGCTVTSVANNVITCPCHFSRFSAANGDVISGPAPRPLPVVNVDVRNGEVFRSL